MDLKSRIEVLNWLIRSKKSNVESLEEESCDENFI